VINNNTYFQDIVTRNLETLYETVAATLFLPHNPGVDYCYVDSSPSPWPSFTYRVSFDRIKPDILIPELARQMEDKKIPPFWITSPDTNISNYHNLLSQNNLKQIMKWPGMIFDLQKVNFTTDKTIHIELINKDVPLKQWFKTAETNLFTNKNFESRYLELLKDRKLRFYALYSDQTIIGTVLVHINDNIAGFYMVSILHDYRKQGFAYRFMCNLLQQLAEEKVQYAVLQANGASINLYRKIGFIPIGDFDIYWKIGLI
jgi:RimJ/RimL family protein N-acetyltransferase